MVNHPNRSKKNGFVKQLKALVTAASVDQIISLAAGRCAIAIFPLAKEPVHLNAYFSSDFPDGAAEEYWRHLGPRASLSLNVDAGLYELPLDWQDSLKATVEEDNELSGHFPIIHEVFCLGLAAKAAEIRQQILNFDLVSVVEDALTEIQENSQE
jgi:hypothetical protein